MQQYEQDMGSCNDGQDFSDTLLSDTYDITVLLVLCAPR